MILYAKYLRIFHIYICLASASDMINGAGASDITSGTAASDMTNEAGAITSYLKLSSSTNVRESFG